LRNHRELRLYLVPSNYLGALHGYVKTRLAVPDRLETVAADASRVAHADGADRHALTVLVIGETARAANFGLDGYSRQTTPNLATEPDVINFRKVLSCGTSTAVSLPCMFLDVGRAGFSDTLARRRENLLDVLQRAGLAVMWRDNNSGCKGLCDRVRFEDLAHAGVAGLCTQAECYDEILLHGLQNELDALDRDAVIVLHMKGSHGPAYHLRYPAPFERYTPACRTNQLDRCGSEAIVNAYDNTLRYTDHVLARTIDLLRRNAARFDGSLIYVSDHGESLGEHGLFLHGMPYAVAPPEQTHVPMVMWFSESAQQRYGLEAACMRRKENDALTHDNLYHSVLGLLDVRTRVYVPQRDVFHDCRAGPLTDRRRVGAPGGARRKTRKTRQAPGGTMAPPACPALSIDGLRAAFTHEEAFGRSSRPPRS
jgi:lipid A ethanolaminephosphotransferase